MSKYTNNVRALTTLRYTHDMIRYTHANKKTSKVTNPSLSQQHIEGHTKPVKA